MINYDLVIIGGGSAGIASSISAYDNGIKSILILEKNSELGGILMQCIHNGFGLHRYKEELTGPEYAEKSTLELSKRGIEYKLKSLVLKITKDLEVHYSNSIDGYVIIKAKAIIIATGCSERTRGAINLYGDRSSGVMTAGLAQRYLNIDGYMVGKKVFILGSGDIGLIMARRMVLEGAEVLGVAEIMPYSNGLSRNIVQCLHDYNIPLYLSHTVKRTIGKNRLEKIILVEVDNNFNYIEGTEKEFEVDTLLLSVGLIPSIPLLEDIGVLVNPKTKGPIVDEAYMTNIKGIFASGNCLHVHDLVDYVSGEGEKAGYYASLFIKDELNKDKKLLDVKVGSGIGYVLPTTVNLNNIEDLEISFRVSKPVYNCYLKVILNGVLIKRYNKSFMLPAEMESIKISKDVLKDGILEIEVENA